MTEQALIAFLRARLDEEEWAANAVKDSAAKRTHYRASMLADADRRLRDVEAKRRIIDIHTPGNDPCDAHDASMRSIPCDTLLLLALPYADHLYYCEEWKP